MSALASLIASSTTSAESSPDQQWAELREDFYRHLLSTGRNEVTSRRYMQRADRFAGWCMYRDLRLHTFSATDFRRYVEELKADGAAANTVIADVVLIRTIFAFMVDAGLRETNPAYPRYREANPIMTRALDEPWADGFRLWFLTNGYAPDTAKHDVYTALALAKWCREREIDPVTATHDDLARFVVGERERISQRAALRNLTAIKNFYRWLYESGQRPDNPTAGIKIKMPPLTVKEPFEPDKLHQLEQGVLSVRDRALLQVFICTGCRRGEIARMKTEHIEWEQGLMKVVGKGQKERIVVLSRRALTALREYLGDREGLIWLSAYRGKVLTREGVYLALKRIGARAGLPQLHPHKLRTSFACNFLERSGDLQAAQVLMGHSKIETTAHYARWNAAQRAIDIQRRLLDEGEDDDGYRDARAGEMPAQVERQAAPAIPAPAYRSGY